MRIYIGCPQTHRHPKHLTVCRQCSRFPINSINSYQPGLISRLLCQHLRYSGPSGIDPADSSGKHAASTVLDGNLLRAQNLSAVSQPEAQKEMFAVRRRMALLSALKLTLPKLCPIAAGKWMLAWKDTSSWPSTSGPSAYGVYSAE